MHTNLSAHTQEMAQYLPHLVPGLEPVSDPVLAHTDFVLNIHVFISYYSCLSSSFYVPSHAFFRTIRHTN
jgi:hypothetical protein